jgi:hypothetical protein
MIMALTLISKDGFPLMVVANWASTGLSQLKRRFKDPANALSPPTARLVIGKPEVSVIQIALRQLRA